MIQFACPQCKTLLQAPEHKRGTQVRCPKCRRRLQIALRPPTKAGVTPRAAPPAAKKRPARSVSRMDLVILCATLAATACIFAFLPDHNPVGEAQPAPPGAQASVAPPGPAVKQSDPPAPPNEPTPPAENPAPPPPPPPAPAQPPMKPETAEPAKIPPVPKKDRDAPRPPKEDDLPPAIPVRPKTPPAKGPEVSPAEAPPADFPGWPGLRTAKEIRDALAEISAAPQGARGAATAEREAALRRLKAYRCVVGVPYRNVVLDEELNRSALAAARVCEKLGRLDHNPPNPGLPEAEYLAGRAGAGASNLAWDRGPGATLATSVDLYLFDSDPSNIDRVGHRRWCLNPSLRKVGFGRSGGFSAMRAHDRSQPSVPDFDFIAYPPPGFMPLNYIGPRHAWSVSLNPTKYAPPVNSVAVTVYPASPLGEKNGNPLPLGYFRVDRGGFGIPNCIIFRPDRLRLAAGTCYVVEIDGIRFRNGEASPPLRYPVHFFALDNVSGKGKAVGR